MQIKLPVNQKITQENQNFQKNKNPLESRQKNPTQFSISREKVSCQRQRTNSQSPISMRLAKIASKIIQQPLSNLQQIGSTQNQINQLIDELDFKLQSNYHSKEHSLIESYRQELIKAHKDLMDLKNNNNEQQIKNQMNEKFLQLKKQRLQLIQVNMFYSNKCLEYKQILDSQISQGSELEREIRFLQKQINNSNQKKLDLMSQIYQKNSPVKNYYKNQTDNASSHITQSLQNIKFQTNRKEYVNHSQTPNKKGSLSTHANTEVMRKMGLTSNNSKDKIRINLNKMPQLSSQVKKLFEQKLAGQQNFHTDRSQIKSGTILSKVSALQGNNQYKKKQVVKQGLQIQSLFMNSVNEIKQKRGIKKQIALFRGQQYTDVQKKQIMRLFLSKQQVKQYIYNIIFDKTDDSSLFRKKNFKQKFKIVPSSQTKINHPQ